MTLEIDGDYKSLDDSNHVFTDLDIDYPFVHWTRNENGVLVKSTFDIERDEYTENANYKTNGGQVLKKEKNEPWSVFRFFEVSSSVADDEYDHWDGIDTAISATDDHLVWKEQSGIYIDEMGQKQEEYVRISEEFDELTGPVTDNQHVVWISDDGLNIYSLKDKKTYIAPLDVASSEIVDVLLYDQSVAVLVNEEQDRFSVQLYDVNELLHQVKSLPEQRVVEPVSFTPKDLRNDIFPIKMQTTNLVASTNYIVWTTQRDKLYYKKRDDNQIFLVEGDWIEPQFIEDDLYVYGAPQNGRHDEDEDEEESGLGIYRINLKSRDIEKIFTLTLPYYEEPKPIIANMHSLNWYQSEDESIVTLHVEDQSTAMIDLDSDDVEAWAIWKDEVAWIVKKKRNYVLKRQKEGQAVQTIKEWSAKDIDINSLAYDGKRIVWNQEDDREHKIIAYDLEANNEKVLFSSRYSDEDSKLTLNDDSLYFTGNKKGYRNQLQRYDFKTKRTTSSGQNVSTYALIDNDIVFGEQNWYLIQKKAKVRGGFTFTYKWAELQKNDQRLWRDVRYSFDPEDIIISVGKRETTWAEYLEDLDEWKEIVKDMPEKIEIRIRF